jgi:transcriptional regulator with XRE-family HTH domain
MGVARNVRTMRTALRETIEDVATATNISADVIRKIENGESSTDEDVLRALATHYGVSLSILKSR